MLNANKVQNTHSFETLKKMFDVIASNAYDTYKGAFGVKNDAALLGKQFEKLINDGEIEDENNKIDAQYMVGLLSEYEKTYKKVASIIEKMVKNN